MAKMTDEQRIELHPTVAGAAHQLARRYSAFTTAADLRQEMWLWLLEQPRQWRFIFEGSNEPSEMKRNLGYLEKNLLSLVSSII